MPDTVPCAKCGRGTLVPSKIRKMPGAVVVLGFLLMIGAVVGLGVGGLAKFGGKWIAAEGQRTPEEVRRSLEAVNVPAPIVSKAMHETEESLTEADLKSLNADQAAAVAKAQVALVAREVDPADVSRFADTLLLGSAIALVVGWILRMKKPGLRCTNCGATSATP